MANENKKINELVSDDDPTSELEALTIKQSHDECLHADLAESDENTFDCTAPGTADHSDALRPELRQSRKDEAAATERLQYDFEQLHSRWLGLKVEIASRTELAGKLERERHAIAAKLNLSSQQLEERDSTIQQLRGQLRDYDLEFGKLEKLTEEFKLAKAELESGDEIGYARQKLLEYEGAIAGMKAAFSGLRNQQQQTELYADELRRQLADLRNDSESAVSDRASLHGELANADAKIAELETQLVNANREADNAKSALHAVREVHAQEIRQLRFELSDAQDTLTEHSQVSEKLAADLLENQTYKVELERMLTDSESTNRNRIESLEKQLARLEKTVVDYESKLETKNEAINALLNELAKTGVETDDSAQPPADNYDESRDDAIVVRPGYTADRMTRLLIGRIDQQELRFPLFKNRLTIGRTQQNDIYLKAQHISRRHAVIVTEGDSTRIIDWGSKNGVYVNSTRVTEHFLNSGDRVAIGKIEFRYEEFPKRDIP